MMSVAKCLIVIRGAPGFRLKCPICAEFAVNGKQHNCSLDLSGGLCKRCGKPFHIRVLRPRKFCSRRCANWYFAVMSRRKSRAKQRQDKLRRVRDLLTEYKVRWRHSWPDWQSWLIEVDPRLTRQFLSKCVARGELRIPK